MRGSTQFSSRRESAAGVNKIRVALRLRPRRRQRRGQLVITENEEDGELFRIKHDEERALNMEAPSDSSGGVFQARTTSPKNVPRSTHKAEKFDGRQP